MSLAEERNADWPSITDFYAHKDIFITGATGFLGKCLVEKLLRDVPDIGRVMILIRPKKGKSVEERLKSVLGSKVGTSLLTVNVCILYKVSQFMYG